jgi:hypothetical protein
MKYLESEVFDALNCALASIEIPDEKIIGRIEAYSCKDTGEDKQLRKELESKLLEEIEELKTPEYSFSSSIVSPFGPLDQTASRRTFFYLIATLNAVFPDYDFSGMRHEVFNKLPSVSMVQNTVQNTLFKLVNSPSTSFLQQRIWTAIDETVDLSNCDIYSFNPDWKCDPYSDEPTIWAYHFFFVNRNLKRIVLFTYRSVSNISMNKDLYDDEDGEFYMEDIEDDNRLADNNDSKSSLNSSNAMMI